MTLGALQLPFPDIIGRRAMFALELVDPITGCFAGGAMNVALAGFRAPRVASDGRLIWTDVEPAADRQVTVRAVARRGDFAPIEEILDLPKRINGDKPADLVKTIMLEPTGLYEPPLGALAVAGMLIEERDGRAAVPGATVRLQLREDGGAAALDALHDGVSDPRGGFVAVMGSIAGATPAAAPPPAPEGGLVGWLMIHRQALGRRYSALLPLRSHRLLRLAAPLVWADLALVPP